MSGPYVSSIGQAPKKLETTFSNPMVSSLERAKVKQELLGSASDLRNSALEQRLSQQYIMYVHYV